MRYYTIKIVDPVTGLVIAPTPGTRQLAPTRGAVATYTSLAGTRNNPGALDIELDIPVVPFAIPVGGSFIRVYGVSLTEIAQASNLNGKEIFVYGGMVNGLPLATAAAGQRGLLIQGVVQQSFGNWVGTEQTLDLIVMASTGSVIPVADGSVPNGPRNIVLNWTKGRLLADALRLTLKVAFPDYQEPVINIDSRLVAPEDRVGAYAGVGELATYLKQATQADLKGDYQGVEILLKQNQFIVFDGSTQANPRQIQFRDMIGQPTWIESPLIQFKTVLRADLSVNDYVQLPPSIATTTAAALSQFKNKSAFTGLFRIQRVRHNGRFRQGNAASWVTTFDAYPPGAN